MANNASQLCGDFQLAGYQTKQHGAIWRPPECSQTFDKSQKVVRVKAVISCCLFVDSLNPFNDLLMDLAIEYIKEKYT